jgi:hypothetical protein
MGSLSCADVYGTSSSCWPSLTSSAKVRRKNGATYTGSIVKKVLHGNLSCLADYGPLEVRAQTFLSGGRPPMKSLIESMLLFDQIVIPTNDYMPLALLISVLGERTVRQLLDDDALKFARFKNSIAYAGGGVGIALLSLYNSDGKTPKYFSAPTDEAVRNAVGATIAKDKSGLSRLAFQGTVEFALENADHAFANAVYNETGQNLSILSHPFHADLRRLPGVTNTDVRGLSGVWGPGQDDDVFQILRVAQACMESVAAGATECDDVYTADQVSQLYKTGLSRVASRLDYGSQYTELREIADLPDIAELALMDKSKLEDILKLRNSSSGFAFRKWFHQNCMGDPVNAAKEYASVLKEIPKVQSAPIKTIRFLATVAVGAMTLPLDPLVGFGAATVASSIDSFLVDRIFKGASPKIFIERLSDIAKVS